MAFENNPVGIESVTDAQELLITEDSAEIEQNLDFYDGDHWQGGEGWSGPIPSQSDSDYSSVAEEIERGFVSKNVIREVTNRASSGILGRQPIVDIVPNRVVDEANPITEQEQSLIDEAKQIVKTWMRDKKFTKEMSKALRQALLADRSTLRLFIPAGFVSNGTLLVNTEKPVANLYLDSPSPLACGVITDQNTREQAGIFLGTDGDNDTAEIVYLLPEGNEETGERFTEIAVLSGDSDVPDVDVIDLDLGGRLTMYEMEFPRLCTPQIVSLQKNLNLNLTMMQRNSVLGGFLERVILNGQLPGHYELDEDGQKIFVRDEYATGAGTINAIQGVPTTDENGQITGYAPADIIYKDPQSPDTFLSAKDSIYQMMLEECDQLHALIAGDASSSGESRRQALAIFFNYLKSIQEQVDGAGEWCLETVLAFAGFLIGEPNKFHNLQVNFNTKLDAGAVPTAEIDLVERLVRVGVISLETAREKVGIEDPAAEARRVEKERVERNGQQVQTDTGDSVVTGLPLTNVDNADLIGEE